MYAMPMNHMAHFETCRYNSLDTSELQIVYEIVIVFAGKGTTHVLKNPIASPFANVKGLTIPQWVSQSIDIPI
jgi:hypothetical protein